MVKVCETIDASSLGPHDMSSALNCVLFFFCPLFLLQIVVEMSIGDF